MTPRRLVSRVDEDSPSGQIALELQCAASFNSLPISRQVMSFTSFA